MSQDSRRVAEKAGFWIKGVVSLGWPGLRVYQSHDIPRGVLSGTRSALHRAVETSLECDSFTDLHVEHETPALPARDTVDHRPDWAVVPDSIILPTSEKPPGLGVDVILGEES